MAAKEAKYTIPILASHVDYFGHVNHTKYLEILEDARWDIMNAADYTLEEVQRLGIGPIVLRLNINYRRELKVREVITVTTRCADYRGRVTVLAQTIHDSKGELSADAEVTMGLLDLKERKLIRPTALWKKVLGVSEV